MKTVNKMRDVHLTKEEARWNGAVLDMIRLLCYDNKHWPAKHSEMVRELTYELLISRDIHSLIGGHEYAYDVKFDGYLSEYPYGPIRLMEFINFFVGHEILDDGYPGVGYFRWVNLEVERCGKDDDGAQPYFHRNYELLAKDYPDAEPLGLENALEVVRFYSDRRPKSADDLAAFHHRRGDDHVDYQLNGTEDDKIMFAMANELRERALNQHRRYG